MITSSARQIRHSLLSHHAGYAIVDQRESGRIFHLDVPLPGHFRWLYHYLYETRKRGNCDALQLEAE